MAINQLQHRGVPGYSNPNQDPQEVPSSRGEVRRVKKYWTNKFMGDNRLKQKMLNKQIKDLLSQKRKTRQSAKSKVRDKHLDVEKSYHTKGHGWRWTNLSKSLTWKKGRGRPIGSGGNSPSYNQQQYPIIAPSVASTPVGRTLPSYYYNDIDTATTASPLFPPRERAEEEPSDQIIYRINKPAWAELPPPPSRRSSENNNDDFRKSLAPIGTYNNNTVAAQRGLLTGQVPSPIVVSHYPSARRLLEPGEGGGRSVLPSTQAVRTIAPITRPSPLLLPPGRDSIPAVAPHYPSTRKLLSPPASSSSSGTSRPFPQLAPHIRGLLPAAGQTTRLKMKDLMRRLNTNKKKEGAYVS